MDDKLQNTLVLILEITVLDQDLIQLLFIKKFKHKEMIHLQKKKPISCFLEVRDSDQKFQKWFLENKEKELVQ